MKLAIPNNIFSMYMKHPSIGRRGPSKTFIAVEEKSMPDFRVQADSLVRIMLSLFCLCCINGIAKLGDSIYFYSMVY